MIRDYSSWIDTDQIIWIDEGGREIGSAPAGALSRFRLAMAFKTDGKIGDALETLTSAEIPGEGTFLQQGETQNLTEAWTKLLSEVKQK